MSCPSASLIKVDAETVRRSTVKMHSEVKNWRAEEREEEIARYINLSLVGFCFKLFRNPVSREDAEMFIDGPHESLSGWGWFKIRGWAVEDDAVRLGTAAKMSSDGVIWLSTEDAVKVQKYLDKPTLDIKLTQ